MPIDPPLVEQIEAFVAQHAMSPVTFGRLAMNDPHFVRDLKRERPRRLYPETVERARSFMADYVAPAADQAA